MPPVDLVEVGGNSIKYPMSASVEMQYHVDPSEIKQEFVVNKLTKDLRLTLEDHLTVQTEMDSNTQGFFGFQEIVSLPDNVELRFNDGQIVEDSQMYDTTGQIDIVDSETGLTIGYIAAPESTDSSLEVAEDIKQGMSKEVMLTQSEPGTQYFFTLEGSELLITTVVNIDWLLSDYTTFPVVIDPSVGTNRLDTGTPGTYELCEVSAQDCHSTTGNRFHFDWPSYGGEHQWSPRFDFTFTWQSSKCGKCKCCLRNRLPILCE